MTVQPYRSNAEQRDDWDEILCPVHEDTPGLGSEKLRPSVLFETAGWGTASLQEHSQEIDRISGSSRPYILKTL